MPQIGVTLPKDEQELNLKAGDKHVQLTNLDKIFWPDLGITKRDLIQYYLSVAPALLPHLEQRAMVMKRYPNGAYEEFFFMKRVPHPHPPWLQTCSIRHSSGNVIQFPVIEDLASLLWVINLGCIDLNQWYARCDDVNRPDYLHFDLDPVPDAGFEEIVETAIVVGDTLSSLGMRPLYKTTGSRGMHIYVPIVRGPTQKQVWQFAKDLSRALEARHPSLITSVYRIKDRPKGHVLVDYNQNAWGRTLASVYSVRPKPSAPVSTPVTREEIEKGISVADFTIFNVPDRVHRRGDLWSPLLPKAGRFNLRRLIE